jgi:hypothetical protein
MQARRQSAQATASATICSGFVVKRLVERLRETGTMVGSAATASLS